MEFMEYWYIHTRTYLILIETGQIDICGSVLSVDK